MPLLLEIRIACAFQRNSIRPQYEFSAGSGTKSVDFHVHGFPEWLIEVVSLTESDAVKDATEDDGLFTSVVLSSLSDDPRHSEEGEILRAMEHIADKAEKFPEPSPGIFHVILTDNRGYAIGMADRGGPEYLRIIYGLEYLLPENLERPRSQSVSTKRSLALREFALGIEALERFGRQEPLRRVHECVFGDLALESEPVDPRL